LALFRIVLPCFSFHVLASQCFRCDDP
jgi:hypothetical protein